MYKQGITIGKFMPLHRGHELMIEMGSRLVDHLDVFVSGRYDDEISVYQRYNWVCEFVDRENLFNVTVFYHIDESPVPIEIDEHGTVLDEDFQNYWIKEFKSLAPNATHFVSSDRYGQTMADLLGIEWVPIDPDRELYSISGTQIRKNPMKHFDMISDVAKPYYTKVVAIVGPESSGKSTMTKMLGEYFNCISVPEYGRILSEAKQNNLTEQDFMNIMIGQKAMIDNAVAKGNSPIVFVDTEAYTTYLFSEIYLGGHLPEILRYAKMQNIDHYIVLEPSVQWIDDGLRILSDDATRWVFLYDLYTLLDEDKKELYSIKKPDFSERFDEAVGYINQIYNLRKR